MANYNQRAITLFKQIDTSKIKEIEKSRTANREKAS